MLRLEGISKSFGALQALDGVDLALEAGTIHGLLGENGAGKSTLMRVLCGLERPDRGRIEIGATPVRIASPRHARALGIGMVHQHFALVPTLDAVDNLALSTGRGLGRLDRGAITAHAQALAARLGWRLTLGRAVGELAVGEQQRLEIISALLAGGRVLVLDEPTAPLTPAEAEDLFRAMRALAAHGASVVFISHKLAEVQAVCATMTILRRGRVVHDGPVGALDRAAIARLLVGAAVESPSVRASAPPGAVRIACAGLTLAPRQGGCGLDRASLSVRAGEILGIAGVDGNGQLELVDALLGLSRLDGGTVAIDGLTPARDPQRLRRALAYIPQDRRRDALAMGAGVGANLLLKACREPALSPWGFARLSAWRARAQALVAGNDVRLTRIEQAVESLSGGNQQKVVVARELDGGRDAVIAVNPTRGLDIAASAAVLRALVAARARGAAVLLVHGDLDELLAISDRVLVMSGGRLHESHWPQCTREDIGALMLGAPAAAAAAAAAVEPRRG